MQRTTPSKPPWLKTRLSVAKSYPHVRAALSSANLHTVCEEARCPNRTECWDSGTATFLILGDQCTRGCAFCAVKRGDPFGHLDKKEPVRVAGAALLMELDYVVLTSVTRDDLPDGGAAAYAETLRQLRLTLPDAKVEVLTPDYLGAQLRTVLGAKPDVFAHNIEVVERLSPHLRHLRFDYRRSLQVLREAKGLRPHMPTKSSLLLGVGETDEELVRTMGDLRSAGVDILVLGQYLQPTPANAPVVEFIPPERFDDLAGTGRRMGFSHVSAGPLVRTSYCAAEIFAKMGTNGRRPLG